MQFRWPIGTDEEDAVALTRLPGSWVNSNPFANYYQIAPNVWNYHDGVDLNLNVPFWNSDWHKPIHAIADGVVTFTGIGGGSWGHIIDIQHDLDNGSFIVCRFGHVENVLVQTGDKVTRGMIVANVGNGDGYYGQTGAHLHWNLSKPGNGIMLTTPNQWCGTSLTCVTKNYTDPIRWIIDRKAGLPLPVLTNVITTDVLIIRSAPIYGSAPNGKVPQYALVQVEDYALGNAYCKLADGRGYVARAYLAPVVSTPMQVTATPSLNRRAGPGTSYAVIGSIPYSAKVNVWIGYAPNQFVMLDSMVGWSSMIYLVPSGTLPPPIPPPTTSTSVWGINLDFDNPTANPPATKLKGLQYVRISFKASDLYRTIEQAFAYYDPIITNYVAQGMRIILIVSQSTVNTDIPYQGSGSWSAYQPNYVGALQQIVNHYGPNVYAYEVWNEEDISADTSFYVPPADYGRLFRACRQALPNTRLIIGGLASGDPVGYLRSCGDISGATGIGVHPYGKVITNIPGLPNSGLLSTYLNSMKTAFNKPLWITEYGIARVDTYDQTLWPKIAQYMRETYNYLKTRSDVPAAVWFAWSDSQDRAGIVHDDQTPKGQIYSQFFANLQADGLSVTTVPPPPQTEPPVPPNSNTSINSTVNRIGLHIGFNAPSQQLIDMAARCKAAGKPLACVVVVSNAKLANDLAAHTTVVARFSDGTERYDPARLDGMTSEQALAYGNAFYFGELHAFTLDANKAHYIKLVNEKGFHSIVGNEFWIGAMQAAESEGRKLAIYGDSMSSVTPQGWLKRLPSLRWAMVHGHAVTVNAYGPTKADGTPDNKPVSTLDGFQWFGGWPIQLYEATPADARPLLIIGETGSSDSTVSRGFDVAHDAADYDRMLRGYSYIKAFAYFTVGQWIGYPQASLDYAISSFEQEVMSS